MGRSDDKFENVAFLLTTGGALFYNGVNNIVSARRVKNLATSKVATSAQGESEFQGFAWAQTIHYRNSMRQVCVYYKIELQKLVKRGKRHYWETQYESHPKKDFLLVDKSGGVVISPKESEIKCQEKVTSWRYLSSEFKKWIYETPVLFAGFPKADSIRDFRVVEKFISLGSPLHAQGSFKTGKGYPKEVQMQRLVDFMKFVKTLPPQINEGHLLFDLNQDGFVTPDEVQNKVYKKSLKIFSNAQNQYTLDLNHPFKIYGELEPSQSGKLYVYDQHEDFLIGTLSDFAVLKIIGGAILIAFGVFVGLAT